MWTETGGVWGSPQYVTGPADLAPFDTPFGLACAAPGDCAAGGGATGGASLGTAYVINEPAPKYRAECAVTTIPPGPPAGYYVTAVGADSHCGGSKGWTLAVAVGGVTECPVTTSVPSDYYVTALVTDTRCGSASSRGWTLEVPAPRVTECAVASAPPAGYYITAVVADSQCGGFKGWTLSMP